MPREYEAMRDRLIASGKSVKEAKSEAAATFIKRHPDRAGELHHAKRKPKLAPFKKRE